MGKTRGLLKKIRDTKGTFHAKMGSIKDRNGMGLWRTPWTEESLVGYILWSRKESDMTVNFTHSLRNTRTSVQDL